MGQTEIDWSRRNPEATAELQRLGTALGIEWDEDEMDSLMLDDMLTFDGCEGDWRSTADGYEATVTCKVPPTHSYEATGRGWSDAVALFHAYTKAKIGPSNS